MKKILNEIHLFFRKAAGFLKAHIKVFLSVAGAVIVLAGSFTAFLISNNKSKIKTINYNTILFVYRVI